MPLDTHVAIDTHSFAVQNPPAGASVSDPVYSFGSMTYKRNFFGIRGPRKLHVRLPFLSQVSQCNASAPEVAQTQPEELEPLSPEHEPMPVLIDAGFIGPRDDLDVTNSRSGKSELPGMITMRNVPPHWHEVLQCWCLNFGGRVKVNHIRMFLRLLHLLPRAPAC